MIYTEYKYYDSLIKTLAEFITQNMEILCLKGSF